MVGEVADYLGTQAAALVDAGVAPQRIAIDPGIGFGKTLEHNLALLARLDEIAALGYPVVVGVSRKRFIGTLTGVDVPAERLAGSLAAAVAAIERGAHVVRVHDVAETVQALAVATATYRGARPAPIRRNQAGLLVLRTTESATELNDRGIRPSDRSGGRRRRIRTAGHASSPLLQNTYFYADYLTGKIWGLRGGGTAWTSQAPAR